MDEEVKERVSTLEVVLGEFIVQTNKSLKRLEEDTQAFREEVRRNQQQHDEQMTQFKHEMTRDRQQRDEQMTQFQEEMRQNRQQRDEQMTRFQEEMQRDRQQRDEQMSQFKDEMVQGRQQRDVEMRDFKQEMAEFKDGMRQDRQDLNKKWGELANKMGTIAEDISAPNMKTVAQRYFGCEGYDTFVVRVSRRNQRDRKYIQEFDVVLTCGDYLFINETKSSPKPEHAQQFSDKLQTVFDYLPEHAGKTVVPIFSGLSIPDSVVEELTKQGIYAMSMGGETVELLNFEALQ